MNTDPYEKLFFLITAAVMICAIGYVYYLPEKIFLHIKKKVYIPKPMTVNDVIVTNNEYPLYDAGYSPIRHRWWHQRHHLPIPHRRPLRPFKPIRPRRPVRPHGHSHGPHGPKHH
jgi:hypothetical protein